MSKIIKLTPEYIEECKKEFEEALTSAKVADGKVSFSKILSAEDRKATVYFTEMAWTKMQSLIREFDKEVAWHGVAYRGDDPEIDDYYITDILVYPQEVSGASVEMDVSKYADWLTENFEDERFNNIRMQGHSHVNMGVTPSGVDLTHQEAILDQLTDSMFYIFMIWNKSKANNIKIYDMEKNVLFEDKDITYEVLSDGYGIEDFIKDAKSMVKERTYQTVGYTYNSGYGYSGGYSGNYGGASKATTPATTSADKDKDEKNVEPQKKNKGKRKGKRRKDKGRIGVYNNASSQISMFPDDDNDPYGYERYSD